MSLIPTIGPATVQHLINSCTDPEEFAALYSYTEKDFCTRYGLTATRAQLLVAGLADKNLLETELQHINRAQVSWTTIVSPNYPPLLKAIHLPPPVLYWRGAEPYSFLKPIAVVGSRDANWYGQQIITELVPPLVQAGCSIISGGALGADTMAHKATLEARGRTCVVLGSGLLRPYPTTNIKLFRAVQESGGSVVSIFPMDMRPLAGNFPARNRVIAGLSVACVVVQAAHKSGARITAEFALDQGRSVCAVPGPITDPLSAGCHELIKRGALLVAHADDVLTELGYMQPEMSDGDAAEDDSAEQGVIELTPQQQLPPEAIVVQACTQPMSMDDLMHITQLGFTELHELLFELQLAGKVTQTFTGLWQRR